MDDDTLYTQCTDIAKCINGLSLSLSEVDGGGSISKISKIVTDVHELLNNFRLLGEYYASEILKKCRELETKNREVEDLSRQLQQVYHESNNIGHSTVPKPDFHFDIHRQQQRREKETGADGRKCVSELSKGEGDLFEYNRTDRSIFQSSKAKSRAEGSRENLTFGEGFPYGSREETGGKNKQMENLAAENRSFSPAVSKDDKYLQDLSRLEPNQKGYFHFGSFKQSSLYSDCDHELSLLDCENIDQVSEIIQQRLVHEQSVVENLCNLMETYQHQSAKEVKNIVYISGQMEIIDVEHLLPASF